MSSTLFVGGAGSAVEDVPLAPSEADLEHRYRQSVLSGEFDQSIVDACFRSEAEWRSARQTYESRLAAAKTLAETVPKLRAAADKAEKATAFEFDLGDHTTLLQLREMIATVNPAVRTATPEGLAKGLLLLAAAPLTRQSVAMNATMHANETERDALRLLNGSSPSTPNVEAIRIRQAIQERQSHIASRRWALIAEENIPAARQRLAAAKALPENVGQSEWTYRRDEIRSAQQNLTELMRLAKTKGQAERDNAADQAEIGRLQIELQTAEQRQRDAALIPTNMVWGD